LRTGWWAAQSRQLTPVERAVFLLHEVFEYGYAEIASIVGKSEANCWQLARRSREALVARRPRFRTDAKQGRRLLDQFIHATTQGDMPGLVALLAEDVTVWADGGGKAFAARKPVIGAEKVARFFLNLAASVSAEAVHVRSASINGHPALVIKVRRGVSGYPLGDARLAPDRTTCSMFLR
jgi:RNA polymerase sigma-70 factor (ECF subfamily)